MTEHGVAAAGAAHSPQRRLAALDQFRGYTMAGMFLVNFIGGFAAVHPIFSHHNTYCSYADTIMPGFFFAMGFSFRLSFLRRAQEVGLAGGIRHALWRNFKLFIVGFLAYNADNVPEVWHTIGTGELGHTIYRLLTFDTFQALVHLACASVWVIPVIGFRPS